MPKNIPAAVVHVPLKTRFAYPRAQLLIIVTPGLRGTPFKRPYDRDTHRRLY